MRGNRKEGVQPKVRKRIIIDDGTKMKNILWRKQKKNTKDSNWQRQTDIFVDELVCRRLRLDMVLIIQQIECMVHSAYIQYIL